MKKFLSLVLALVMTMSLVTVSAGAKDYADADDIKYVEAVDVLSALGVLEGDENGFRPNDTLKRSEAAKIIAALNLTPKTAAGLSADTAPFADVAKSHWAAGYIAEGVDSGIIAGVGDNKFAPDAELTGYAFLKMLLVSLGYDAAVESFTGANWSVNVAKLADELELTDGNDDFVGSKAVTREEAALYALNTLKAETVTYDGKGSNITIGDVVINTAAGEIKYGDTFMKKNYNKKLDCYTVIGEEDEKEAVTDEFGRPSIYWEYDGEPIGYYADAADYVLVAKKDTTMKKLIEDNKLEKKIISGYTAAAEVDCGTVVELWVTKKAVTASTEYSYDFVEIKKVKEYDEEDDEAEDYEASVYYEFEDPNEVLDLENVTYVDSLNEDGEDDDAYAEIGEFKKGDIVVVTMYQGEAMEFALAETFEGVASKKGTNTLTIDGTKYNVKTGVGYDFDDTYTYYLDPNGIIIGSELSDEADKDLKYAYVLAADAQTENDSLISAKDDVAKVKVMHLDGEIEVLDYALFENDDDKVAYDFKGDEVLFVEDDECTFETTVTEGWYAYTLNKDGEITLEEFDTDEAAVKAVKVVEDERNVATGLRANTDTVVTVLDEDGKVVKSYKGYKNFPETALEDTALVIFGDSKSVAAEIYVYDADAEKDDDEVEVAMFVSKGDTVKDGREVTFYVGDEKVTYVVLTAALENLADAQPGMLYTFDLNSDGEVKKLAAAEYAFGTVDVAGGDFFTLTADADTEIEMAEDCAIYQLSKNAKTLSVADELDEDVLVVYVVNSDDEATAIYMHKDICTGWCPEEVAE